MRGTQSRLRHRDEKENLCPCLESNRDWLVVQHNSSHYMIMYNSLAVKMLAL